MFVKLLTEHHLEFLSLKRGCRGSSESTLVIMPHCWKSHALAQFKFNLLILYYFRYGYVSATSGTVMVSNGLNNG